MGGEELKRWAKTLYNHPISSVIDYFVVNLKASADRVDNESGGRLHYKLRDKVEQNEEEIKNGIVYEPITTEWMFSALKVKHREPSGKPITRITNQLEELNVIIWNELEKGVKTPEGVCDWVGRKKKRELKGLGTELANREVFDYFSGAALVKNHTLNNIIIQHCLSIDFINKIENSDAETFHDEFALFLSKIDEFLDTEAHGGEIWFIGCL